MSEIYLVGNQKYSVGKNRLKDFLSKFPNAKKENGSQVTTNEQEEDISWFDQTWFGRGFAAASTTGEATSLMNQNFSNVDMNAVQDFINAKQQEASNYTPSERMQAFQKQYVEEGQTWSAFFRGVRKQPGLLPELFVQSLGTQAGTLFDSPATSLAAAGVGAAGGALAGPAGALAGAFGGLASSMEAALTFGELIETRLKEKNQEFTDENIIKLLQEEGNSIRNKAIGRGLSIGAIEGLSGGLAGKAAVAARRAVGGVRTGVLAAGATGTAVEAVGGATGEIAGRLAADQEMDPAEIGFEAITGTVTAPLNVSAALLTAKKPTYRLNGEEVTYEQMKKFVDEADPIDIATADIKMEDDYTGIGKKAKQKQEIAIETIKLSGDEAVVQDVKEQKRKNKIQATINLLKEANKIANIKDAFTVKDSKEAVAAYKELQKQYGKDVVQDNPNVKDADGIFIPTPDGNVVIINEDIAAKTGQINVGGHELLHGITQSYYESLNPKQKEKFISDFKNTLSKESREYVGNIIQKRIDQGENLDIKATDEWLNVYSDGIVKKEITYNESAFTKFRNFLHNIFRKFGYKKEFGSGIATYNFMRDYNENIMKFNRISGRALAVAGQTATGSKVKQSVSPQRREQISSAIQEIGSTYRYEGGKSDWDKGGADAAIIEIKNSNYLDDLIASKYKADRVPFDFVDKVYSELTSHIKNFNPEINDNLFGWINSQLAKKAGNVYNREYKKVEQEKTARDVDDRTKEGEIKIQVAAEEDAAIKEFEERDISPQAEAKRKREAAKKKEPTYSELRQTMGIETGSELYNRVLDVAKKTLLKAYDANKEAREIQRDLRNEASDFLFKQIKNFLGSGKTYIDNLKKFRVSIVNTMFTADLVQLERELPEDKKVFTKFVKKLTSEQEVIDAVDNNRLPESALKTIGKGQSVNLYEKIIPTESKFVEFFDQPAINPETGKRSGLKGTRKDGLAKYISGALNYDATMEVAQDTDVIEARKLMSSEDVIKDDIQELSNIINRDLNVKFSVTPKLTAKKKKLVKVGDKIILDLDSVDKIYKIISKDSDQIPVLQNLSDKDSEKYGGKTLINMVIDSFDDRAIERLDNNSIKRIILKNIKKGQKFSTVYEQFFISLANEAVKKLKANLKVNLVVTEGGKSDVSFESNNVFVGLEIKMDQARGVSYTYKFDGTSTNPNSNNTEEQAELIKEVEEQAKKLPNISKDNLIKGVTIDQLNTLKINKHSFNKSKTVQAAYLEEHYTKKANPEYFINIGEAGTYYMLSDNKEINLIIEEIAKELNIPRLTGEFQLNTVMNLGRKPRKTKNNTYAVTIRIQPRIDSNSKINFPEKSKLNLSNKIDMEKFVKTINNKLNKSSNNNFNSKLSKSVSKSRATLSYNENIKGITILDFDDTLATTQSLVRYTGPNGETGTLNAEQYASQYQDLLDKGYEFDFSEFNKVVKGKIAPLFQKALKLQKKFGPKNMFILTARPPAAQQAIFDFLKANGLNIPIENITGLGNSTSEAKALWVADKVGEGFNDFYFADDALQNVQAVKNILEQFDVKSKVQQAKVKFSKSMNDQFNDILEDVTNIDSKKRFSDAKGRKRGQGKGRFRFFVPPSHEDFVGLLYNFIGKGEQGNKHRDFFEDALIKPLNRAYRELNMAKQSIANDFRNLNKQMLNVRKKLVKDVPGGDFIYDDAVRVYLWDKFSFKIPGLSETDQKRLVDLIKQDKELKLFADKVGQISKIEEGYVEPGEHWTAGSIKQDLADATGRVGRKKFFTDFIENSDQIFGKMVNGKLTGDNVNKIRAAFGDNFVEALQDMLDRIQTGTNRKQGGNRQVNNFLDYLNGSIGATMFFNARSAVLQTLSTVNFINFGDNNIFKAAKAFADQQQFWSDFAMIFNSDFLKQRRAGVGFDVNGAEIAAAVKKAKNPVKAAVAYILNKGFLPTQMADSFAIALGGSSMYRNRINTYIKQGLSQKEAETKAFEDFQATAESTQQSARPDMISQQQASVLGRMILAFQNVTSQYVRLMKKAGLDLINRRKTPPYNTQVKSDMSNISKIIYYGAVQNIIFYSLQSALFAMAFEDDQDEDERNEKFFKNKKQRLLNGSIDSILRGSGVGGAIISVLKNAVIKYGEQNEKGWGKQLGVISDELLQLSPPIGIKIRKLDSFEKTMEYNKKIIPEMDTFDIDNPMWDAYGNLIEGLTNVPVARLNRKVENVRSAIDSENAWWQRLALALGWSKWELGIEDKEIKEVKERIKKNNKQIRRNKRPGPKAKTFN